MVEDLLFDRQWGDPSNFYLIGIFHLQHIKQTIVDTWILQHFFWRTINQNNESSSKDTNSKKKNKKKKTKQFKTLEFNIIKY